MTARPAADAHIALRRHPRGGWAWVVCAWGSTVDRGRRDTYMEAHADASDARRRYLAGAQASPR